MLGFAVRVDDTIIVACCSCLGYTRLEAAHWHATTLLCTRCYRRQAEGAPLSLGAFGSSATAKCRSCSLVRKPGDRFARVVAYDEALRAFVDVYLCERHARKPPDIQNIRRSSSEIDPNIIILMDTRRHHDASKPNQEL